MGSPSEHEMLEIVRAMELASRWGSTGHSSVSFKLKDWNLAQKLKELPPTEELDTAAICRLSSDRQEVEYLVKLSKALLVSTTTLLGHYTRRLQPITAKLSKGFASLPDDVVSLIFKFATHDKKLGTKYALWLSQVSRRFRTIALEDRSLWSKLCLLPDTTEANLKRFISRSGTDTDLHVFINFQSNVKPSVVRNFLDVCAPPAFRWRSLTISGLWDDGDGSVTIGDEIHRLIKQRHLVLPRLDELCLVEERVDFSQDEDLPFPLWDPVSTNFVNVRPWDIPNLRSLRCTGYIPPPSFPFTSFTSVTFSLELIPFAIADQIRRSTLFLVSKPGVTDFVLDLDYFHHESEDELDVAGLNAVSCPGVTSFALGVSGLDLSGWNVIGSTVKTLRMPKLERYRLTIGLSNLGDPDCTALSTLLGMLLPDPECHPSLASLTVDLRVPAKENNRLSPKIKAVKVDIPLHKIPHVSTLCVSTFGRVSFSRQSGRRQDGDQSTCLREVQLLSCRNMDMEGLQCVLQSLKDVGAWDKLERVVIRDCTLLDGNTVSRAVGEERLHFMDH